jgi:hypothetical protein
MVSDKEGEESRKIEQSRQDNIKVRLNGAIVTDIVFDGMGIINHTIRELVLEKDGTKFIVEIEAEKYYDCIEKRLIITDCTTYKEVVE